jgi:hypothetical protein
VILMSWIEIDHEEIGCSVEVGYVPADIDVGVMDDHLYIEDVRRTDTGEVIPESVWGTDSGFRSRVGRKFDSDLESIVESHYGDCPECGSLSFRGRCSANCHNRGLI